MTLFQSYVILGLCVLSLLGGCVGQFETKPTLTAACNVDWQQYASPDSSKFPSAHHSQALTLLVFNIHDRLLPGSIFGSGGHPEEEVACIGDLATRYDLVLFQEAFVRPSQIARYTGHLWAHHPVFTEGGGGDWWPLNIVCEICMSPGLLMLASEKPEFVHIEPYTAYAGWNTKLNKADDFFSKGFQLVKFKQFWVLNSHMDSGRGQESIDARIRQFRQITAAIKKFVPEEAPIVLGMDSNLRPEHEEQDKDILDEFLRSNDLTLIVHHGPDLIAARRVGVEQARVLPFKKILSDHDALSGIVNFF